MRSGTKDVARTLLRPFLSVGRWINWFTLSVIASEIITCRAYPSLAVSGYYSVRCYVSW
ncbi:hypothetical protein KCP75_23900 [Salmonella enterica subsp. enterica]|nr:hypothetical protein KCP75_23900 [Salmonella enterica subsp. enterica]